MSKKRYWRNLEELENTPEFQAALAREFPEDESTGEGRFSHVVR
jgi:MoCo/4Fe-4S cofactor protein with predicted Tat translocation signal